MEDGKNQLETGAASIRRSIKGWLWVIPLVILGIVTRFYLMKPAMPEGPEKEAAGPIVLKAYNDVRSFTKLKTEVDVSNMDLTDASSIIPTLWFNEKTKWPDKMPKGCDPKTIMETAKNPGLGIRALHSQGITGEGVSVEIGRAHV